MRQVQGLLGVQPPLQHGDQGLGGVMNNSRTARRAQSSDQLITFPIENQCRTHAGTWPLARLDTVSDRRTGSIQWPEREVSQLVVEQITTRQTGTAIGKNT